MLEFFTDKTMADDELIALLRGGARIARERLGPTNETTLNLVSSLAGNLGRLGAWTNALEVYLSLIETHPDDSDFWQRAHAVALAAGQLELSRKLRQGMVTRLAASTNPVDNARLARTLLLSPDHATHLKTALEATSRGFQGRPHDRWRGIIRGIAEYRQGNWAEALNWLQPGERSDSPGLAALSRCFGAIFWGREKPAGGRPSGRKAGRRMVEPWRTTLWIGPRPGRQVPMGAWRCRWRSPSSMPATAPTTSGSAGFICQLALDEARQLMGQSPKQ